MEFGDLEPARTAFFDGSATQLRVFNRLNLQPWVSSIYKPRACPAGATELSPGFQPWEPNKRFALKGREMRAYQMKLAPVAAQKSECAIGTCDNWTFGPRFRLVRTSDLAPPTGRVARGGRFPGLKPWAEFCSPFGAQNKRPQPGPDSSGDNSSLPTVLDKI
ncbi:MAG: hypothetical protein QOI53_1611 [Verrucomicrobiota bacterium]|nr:hypothetical protein [Verrucomicrobiota bacterium]